MHRGLVIAFFSVLAAASPAGSQECRIFHEQLPTLGSSTQITAADLDGNGHEDLIYLASTLTVRLANGSGGFGEPVGYSIPGTCEDFVVSEFNGDGAPDVAVAASIPLYSVFILLGDGLGGFAAPIQIPVGSGVIAIEDSDLNSDLASDLVVVRNINGVSADAVVLLGDGLGGFAPPSATPLGAPARLIEVGDQNGDARPDLVVADEGQATNLRILFGDGAGGFGPPQVVDTLSPFSLHIADPNEDGKPDLLVTTASAMSVYYGTGSGSFSTPVLFSVGNIPRIAAWGHLDPDPHEDLVVVNWKTSAEVGTITIVRGDGVGYVATNTLLAGADPRSVALLDFDSDGDLDAATGQECGISLLAGDGQGGFENPVKIDLTGEPSDAVAVDLNLDGFADLAVSNRDSTGGVWVSLGTAAGLLTSAKWHAGASFCESVAAGDIDADGRPDLVLVDGSHAGKATVLLGDGQGGFTPPVSYPTGTFSRGISIHDLNGDGNLDLAVTNRHVPGTVAILLGDGSGSFSTATTYPTGAANPVDVAAGDFDSDGNVDLVVANQGAGGLVSLLKGDGTGAFSFSGSIFISGVPELVVAEDLDEDTHPDLLLAPVGSLTDVAVLLGDGAGGFSAPSFYGFFCFWNPTDATVEDLDADGNIDLVAPIELGNVWWFPGKATAGTFGQIKGFMGGSKPNSIAIGDFNGDARPDMAMSSKDGGAYVLYNEWPVGSFGGGCAGTGGFTPELALLGCPGEGSTVRLVLTHGLGGASAVLLFGLSLQATPLAGPGSCELLITPVLPAMLPLSLSPGGPGDGQAQLQAVVPTGLAGIEFTMQAFAADPGAALGASASNALVIRIE